MRLVCVLVESLQPVPKLIRRFAGEGTVVRVLNEYVPLLPVREWFHVPGASRLPHESILVLVEADGHKLALQVDDLVGQQQVVIKSLEANYKRVAGISGATILGDGRVALLQIGRESCRERVGRYGSIQMVAVSSKKKKKHQ